MLVLRRMRQFVPVQPPCITANLFMEPYRYNDLNRLVTKPTKWHMRPAKTQISLGMRPVWSESSLSAWRRLGALATHRAHSVDSDQTGRMPRLIWVFAGRTCHFVGFVTMRLICNKVNILTDDRTPTVFYSSWVGSEFAYSFKFGIIPFQAIWLT